MQQRYAHLHRQGAVEGFHPPDDVTTELDVQRVAGNSQLEADLLGCGGQCAGEQAGVQILV